MSLIIGVCGVFVVCGGVDVKCKGIVKEFGVEVVRCGGVVRMGIIENCKVVE